jgi:antitoxin MazE
MKTKIVRIGNSQGLRLPRPLLEQAGFAADADVDVEARAGWAAAFERMARAGDDTQRDPPAAPVFDESKWPW